MAVVYANNVIEIAAVHAYNGTEAVNVWHMYFDSELGTDTKQAVVEDFRDNWQDHMLDLVHNSVIIQRFEWRSLDVGDGSNGVVLPNGSKATTGLQTGTGSPPNVALLVHKNTSDRPRGRRDGRSFLVGVPESNVDANGSIPTVTQTGYNSFLTAFYNGVSDTSGAPSGDRYPVVLETTAASRAPGSDPVVIGSRRVTSLTIDPLVATQRDRLR
jgi:hypothetical protein